MKQAVVLFNPQQAHQAISAQLWPWVKSMTQAGHKLVAEVRLQEDDRSLRQNRYYWGPCLTEISRQAQVGGQRYAAEAWHELFKRQFLGYQGKKVAVAGAKRKRVIRQLRSTTDLSVRAMSKYLDQVQAYAATELGVEFSVPSWEQYSGQEVDPDTGEIHGR